MKYLMIYEAFESKALSNTVNFIKSKIGNKNLSNFLRDIKKIQKVFEFPISNIKSENIKYMNAKKALSIEPNISTVYAEDNNIFNIKYWFSLEDGYLGNSCTGRYSSNPLYDDFNKGEIKYIKDKYKTGKITQITNWSDLKHGDFIIGYYKNYEDPDYLGIARLYIESGRIYAIQNISAGSTPYNDNWRSWGRSSWSLGYLTTPHDDHLKMHKYEPNEDELLYIREEGLINSDKEHYLSSNGLLDRVNYPTYHQDADFCIIIDINEIIKSDFKKLSDIKKERDEIKSGALSLMSDEQIKKANIDRYLNKIILNMGIRKDSNLFELKNLQNFVKKSICDEFAFIAIFRDSPSIHNILDFSRYIYSFMKTQDMYYYDSLIIKFKDTRNSSNLIKKDYNNTWNAIKRYCQDNNNYYKDNKDNIDKIIEIFEIFEKISKEIINYIDSKEMNSIHDLNAIFYKLNSIYSLSREDIYSNSQIIRKILNDFRDSENIIYHIEMSTISGEEIDNNIKRVKDLLKVVKSLLN
jgi:hypothetical protein